jgi:hypothetical protein
MPCRFEHFSTDWYLRWSKALGFPPADRPSHAVRKWWEYAAIAEALSERDMLRPGRRGLGFAVGREPLASLFAAHKVDILATDLGSEAVDELWSQSGQHAARLEDIWAGEHVCPRRLFDKHVRFAPVDMNRLDGLAGGYDFLWSSCAFEHLGSLEHGFRFVTKAMSLLRPGGVAVHTTEYNVCSNSSTVETGGAVIYRRRDLEDLERSLRLQRYGMMWPDFDAGSHAYDLDYDEEPFFTRGRPHLKLLQDGFVCTSFSLVITA